jgi:single-stranded-DNA-specific exonuclease
MTSLLGVERSVGCRRWVPAARDERAVLALSQREGLPDLMARLLVARGIAADDVGNFLEPSLRRSLPDPAHLLDMERAAERLVAAIRAAEPIVVFGDYDVDGATSAALLIRFLRQVGSRADAYIPDRQREGYGPNAPALEKLAAAGARVVVTVDCGQTAHAALAVARAVGLDVIVCDHHQGEPQGPPAYAVVNPNRFDEVSPHRQLAAVGVAFLLAIAVNRALRRQGWFASRPEPDLTSLLDLVALGTVCDVVPLTGVNRVLVAQGLKILRRRGNPGLAALADVAGLRETPTAHHLGFMLGPRVNAGGRVGHSGHGVALLTSDDPDEVRRLARDLDGWNATRREVEAAVMDLALVQAEAAREAPFLLVAGEGWHPGVIGIVAGRLRERFDRPVLVAAIEGGVAKGSGRSVPGVDLGQAIIAARQAGLLMNGGGHAMAAGFTAEAERLPALTDFLADRLVAPDAGAVSDLAIDGLLATVSPDDGLLDMVERIGPFGAGNPEPRFVMPAVAVERVAPMGEGHLRCWLADAGGARLDAVLWRQGDQPLGDALRAADRRRMHVAGRLRRESWNGRQMLRLTIEDLAPVTS